MMQNLKQIDSKYYPAMLWSWNTTITKDGIKKRIDKMCQAGTKSLYVCPLPKEFRPNITRTHLEPQYLTDEFFELIRYTYAYAREKGMYIWMYNEAGWPSGNANGFVVAQNPDLYMKEIGKSEILLKKGESYAPCPTLIAAFCGGKRITEGYTAKEDVTVTQYYADAVESIHSDICDERTFPLFCNITYEKMKEYLSDYMGKSVKIMFDDEAMMHSWSKDLDKKFFERYGYDIADYMPIVNGDLEPQTEKEHLVLADFYLFCGELVRKNYFIPNRKWLNDNNMLLAGHLNLDSYAYGGVWGHYGNLLQTLREFDMPGVDEIWSQISYPKDGKCCFEGTEFYPRLASSAARQNGTKVAISESFCVTGSQLTYDEMRFIVNYQAVMGINLFNFTPTSYDEETAMSLQFRPNFNVMHPAMDFQTTILDYTARLSYIMQNSDFDTDTALYYPARSIAANEKGVWQGYDEAGKMLEESGVSYDIIDEIFVNEAELTKEGLCGKHVSYKNVIVPNASFELPETAEKLNSVSHEIVPCIERKSKFLKARRQITKNGCVYFVTNCDKDAVSERIAFKETAKAYEVDLINGDIYEAETVKENDKTFVNISLAAGEGIMLYFTDDEINTVQKDKYEFAESITDFSSYINRRFVIDDAPHNEYFECGEIKNGLYEWDKGFSGEVTYTCHVPQGLPKGDYMLDLGEVRYCARVFLNGAQQGEAVFTPYRVKLHDASGGDEIKIVVANTIANECAGNEFFEKTEKPDVGPYNEKMQEREKEAPAGGLFGEVKIYKKIAK